MPNKALHWTGIRCAPSPPVSASLGRTKDILNPHLEGNSDCSSQPWLAQRRWPRRIRLSERRLLNRTTRTNKGGLRNGFDERRSSPPLKVFW